MITPETSLISYIAKASIIFVVSFFGFSVKKMRKDLDLLEVKNTSLELKIAEQYPTKADFKRLEDSIKESIRELKETIRSM